MRSAKRREEVIQRILVGDVDSRQSQTPLVRVAVEEVVVADGESKRFRAEYGVGCDRRFRCLARESSPASR